MPQNLTFHCLILKPPAFYFYLVFFIMVVITLILVAVIMNCIIIIFFTTKVTTIRMANRPNHLLKSFPQNQTQTCLTSRYLKHHYSITYFLIKVTTITVPFTMLVAFVINYFVIIITTVIIPILPPHYLNQRHSCLIFPCRHTNLDSNY